jgi:UDP-glucose 4-epimerase
MRIFITGSSSHLAAVLLPKLCVLPAISAIIGIDLQASCFAHPKFTHHIADIRSPEIATLMQCCDALLHLAFVVLRGKMNARTMHDINVQGAKNIFESARSGGVERLIHLSSAAVYGSGECLSETAPLQPLPGFLYGQHKAEVETWLTQQYPQTLRLRPHIILGPHCQPLLVTLLHQPLYVALHEPQPRMQCVHEDDVADAIIASLFSPASGPLNLAAPGDYSFKEAIAQRHSHSIPIPFNVAKLALNIAWRLSGFGGEVAWLDGIRHTLTLDCSLAKQTLAWQPKFDAHATLASVN